MQITTIPEFVRSLTMRTSTSTLKIMPPAGPDNESDGQRFAGPEKPGKSFPPKLVSPSRSGNGHGAQSLRMYTEEQVAEMLQVSLSQLRKWRMKKYGGKQGPPFRKIGRLVRYPESALLAYINGE
jgi:predicted DNA-binding transcriptional regulator AlpA